MKPLRTPFLARCAALALFGLTASTALPASEYIVQALPMQWAPPDGGAPIVMWGYRTLANEPLNCPGPNGQLPNWAPLVLRHDQNADIVIRLFNCLPVATSMLVSGMTGESIGTRTEGAAPLTRLGGGAEAAVRTGNVPTSVQYRFRASVGAGNTRRSGTYLIQSGSDPKRQVQMGLYGAIVTGYAGFTNGVINGDTNAPNNNLGGVGARDRRVLFSEIDPALHPISAAGTLAGITGTAGTVNLRNYSPRYFLINGQPFTAGAAPLVSVGLGNDTAGNPNNGKVLLRLLNAGFQDRAPQILGGEFTVVSRDSRPVAANRRMPQNTDLLGAGASLDVSIPRGAAAAIPLYDRRLGLTNGSNSDGGMRGMICIGATGDPRCP